MRLRNLLLAAGLVACLVSFGFALSSASAGPSPVDSAAVSVNQPVPHPQAADNSLCLSCHSQAGMKVGLDSGETLQLTIDSEVFGASVHGTNEVACTSCHTDITGFPHPDRKVQSLREVTLTFSASCAQCHSDQSALAMDSVHQEALAAGNQNAAVCADCHNPHTQKPMTDPATGKLLPEARLEIPNTCAKCHNAIYGVYAQSVHGAALTQEGNLDVPTCVDCHGVHNIQSPTTASFRNSVPALCAKCHTDETLMKKYGLSTQVLSTYVADFHGTTVEIFSKEFPDQPTNKPVCTDCHGTHDIMRVDDPAKGLAVRENLLKKCQACHPGATANFPDAWMSHYIPSPDKYPVVYYINLFYKFMIPGVLGSMGLLVVMDFTRMMINRFRKPKPAVKQEEPPAPVAPAPVEEAAASETPQVEEETPPVEEVPPLVEAEVVEAEPAVAPEDPEPAEAESAEGESPAPEESNDENEEAHND
jgi:predicted CXXCH cytochrome family protein